VSNLNAQLDQAFQGAALRPTAQRYAVLEFLAQHPVHATAEEIFRAVNRNDPRASRATVYNNLRSLAKAGLVREVMSEGKAARFDANLRRHHHFICERCGSVEDISWFDLAPSAGRAALGGRDVSNYEIVFRGACVRCRDFQPKRGAKL
jgi:Fur family transcriptional regulator, peroxide stress response regulator